MKYVVDDRGNVADFYMNEDLSEERVARLDREAGPGKDCDLTYTWDGDDEVTEWAKKEGYSWDIGFAKKCEEFDSLRASDAEKEAEIERQAERIAELESGLNKLSHSAHDLLMRGDQLAEMEVEEETQAARTLLATPETARVQAAIESIGRGVITCKNNGGKGSVNILFNDLEDAQACHSAISKAVRALNKQPIGGSRKGQTMNVNELMAELRKLQKEGHGKTEVHVTAQDNLVGESQGCIWRVSYFEKGGDDDNPAGRDEDLYNMAPDKMVCLHL